MTEGADANAALKMDAKPGASARGRDASAMIRKLNVVGLAMVVVFVGCIGSWAAISELAGAVIAAGTVIVESVDKKVQHPTGGVVKEIVVQDGSAVEEGQILVRLDDTIPRATLGVLRSQLDENNARRVRLLAEREGADFDRLPGRPYPAHGRDKHRRRGEWRGETVRFAQSSPRRPACAVA